MTKLTLKEFTGLHSNLPSWKTVPQPEEKIKRKKKNPSRLRRDAKRNEAYLAKKAGSGATDPVVSDPSSLPVHGSTPATPRRVVAPGRRLGRQNDGSRVKGEGGRCGSIRGEGSPIPQLDGGGGET